MVGVPIKYRRNPEGLIQSFSFTELATGRGYVQLWMCDFEDGSYRLVESSSIYGHLGNVGTSGTIDYDFDLLISNKPFLVEGDAYVTLVAQIATENGVGTAYDEDFAVTIRHVDTAGTETQLGTASANFTGNVTNATTRRASYKINLARTKFLIGEKLRLTITAPSATANIDLGFGCDPKNRTLPDVLKTLSYLPDWSAYGSESFILLPIRVDL